MSANHTTTSSGPSPGFIKATIKIAHPDWTVEQIEAEYQIKVKEMNTPNTDPSCEFCSS